MARTLGIIGGGNMGSAILEGAIQRNVLTPSEVIVAELDRARRKRIQSIGCATTTDAKETLDAEQVMIAVKPQSFVELASAIAPLPRSMVVISIMAGLSSRKIRSGLGDEARVVRIMPNTPCQINEGMSALALGDGAKKGDDALARSLFEAIGRCIQVEESQMHAVTAVSGSGPAYIFLLAESMEQAALQLGLTRAQARIMVTQTVLGAARLLEDSETRADQLRQSVTSPGGTTAAAMEVMFERELPQIISEAIIAAKDRGEELDHA